MRQKDTQIVYMSHNRLIIERLKIKDKAKEVQEKEDGSGRERREQREKKREGNNKTQ